jgi:hypothetical protein
VTAKELVSGVTADVGGITLDAGEEVLTVYRFNTGAALLLLAVRHLRAPSLPLQPGPVRGQRRVPKKA